MSYYFNKNIETIEYKYNLDETITLCIVWLKKPQLLINFVKYIIKSVKINTSTHVFIFTDFKIYLTNLIIVEVFLTKL